MENVIDKTVEINSWDDMKRKYPMDRGEMTEEQEKEWVNDCFLLYEKEGFARCFWSCGGDYSEYHENPFKVIKRADKEDGFDIECLPAWIIEFGDGKSFGAYPDEIIPSEMISNGCKIENLKKGKINMQITIINCDDRYVDYEWKSIKEFISDMHSNKEKIPMLDDAVASVDTQNDELANWWKNEKGISVDDLLEKCEMICFKDSIAAEEPHRDCTYNCEKYLYISQNK